MPKLQPSRSRNASKERSNRPRRVPRGQYDAVSRANSLRVRTEKAQAFAELVWPHVRQILESGHGWKATATALNKLYIPTRRGKEWDSKAVRLIAKRMDWKRPPAPRLSADGDRESASYEYDATHES